jgi:DNA-binding transcriptional LysR family regulator
VDYIDGRRFIVVAAPALASRLGLHEPKDLRRATLLNHTQAPDAWNSWAAEHLGPGSVLPSGLQFEQYAVLIQAVISGLGVALVPSFLVSADLAGGLLMEPMDAPVNLSHGHYLCTRIDRQEVPHVEAFRRWLIDSASP